MFIRNLLPFVFIILAIFLVAFIVDTKAEEPTKPKIGFVSQPVCVTYNKGDIYNPFGNEKPWWLTEEEYHSHDSTFDAYYVRCGVKVGPNGTNFVRWENK